MKTGDPFNIPVGTKAFILSKLYYGVLSKSLEQLEVERYYSILHYIHGNDGCNQQRICNSLAIDKTAMVKIIDNLIQIGFVERTKNPDDRREHFITLTKKGLKQTHEIVAAFNLLDEQIFQGIANHEKQIFTTVLNKICDQLNGLPSNILLFNYSKTNKPKSKFKTLTENKIENETT